MTDYLYLDDYINLYSKKKKQIIVVKPYKDTLKYGHIMDKEKFLKRIVKIYQEENLNKGIFNNHINVIINRTYNKEDKRIIREVLEELNYKKIAFMQENDIFKLDKNKLYINFNYSYFSLSYIMGKGKLEVNNYDYNLVNKEFISKIIGFLNKEKVYIYGKNQEELVNMLGKRKYRYYYFEESDNLVLKMVLLKCVSNET